MRKTSAHEPVTVMPHMHMNAVMTFEVCIPVSTHEATVSSQRASNALHSSMHLTQWTDKKHRHINFQIQKSIYRTWMVVTSDLQGQSKV